MIICHCRGVSDRDIRRAVRKGARTPDEVARVCQAGTGCGGCTPVIDSILSIEAHGPVAPAAEPAARS